MPTTSHTPRPVRAVVLWAQQDSPNLGLHALAEGGAALVRSAWPGAEVEFQDYGRGSAPRSIGSPKALARELVQDREGLRSWIRGFDLALDLRSGDSFSDIYGLRRLATMSAMGEFAHRCGTPVVLGPQTLGPFSTVRGRLLARRSLRTAALVMSRDRASTEAAAQLGRPVDVESTDVVFHLPVPDVRPSGAVLLNISGLLWHPNPHVDHLAYRRTVAGVHGGLVAAGRRVELLAHVLESTSPDNDVPAVREFAARHAPGTTVHTPRSLAEVRALVAGAELVVGARMHACLNALSCATPAVAMAYSRKFVPLLEPLGWTASVDLRTSPDPVAEVLSAARRPGLAAEAAAVRARTDAALVRAGEELRRALPRLDAGARTRV